MHKLAPNTRNMHLGAQQNSPLSSLSHAALTTSN